MNDIPSKKESQIPPHLERGRLTLIILFYLFCLAGVIYHFILPK